MFEFPTFLLTSAVIPAIAINGGAAMAVPQTNSLPEQIKGLLASNSDSRNVLVFEASPVLPAAYTPDRVLQPTGVLTSTANYALPAAYTPDRVLQQSTRGHAVQALERLRTFQTWSRGWDGDGAPAPKAAAIGSATKLLGLLSAELGRTPTVALNAHGEPMFMFIDGDFEVAVTVESKRRLNVLVARGDIERGGLLDFDGSKVPHGLRTAINELRAA